MNVVHLTASPFFGGPERQMLGLAKATPAASRPVFLCFGEHGLATPFMQELRNHNVRTVEVRANTPRLLAAAQEVADHLRQLQAGVVLCHGYKPDIIGYLAARRAGIPAIAVARGWTGATMKVKAYEWLDSRIMRRMDHVVCVSEGHACKVRGTGMDSSRMSVIRNAIDVSRFSPRDEAGRRRLESLFPKPPRTIVLAAGRLSPEKGFGHLVEAASVVHAIQPHVGFLLVGHGPLGDSLQRQINAAGLQEHFILAGFRRDVDALMPNADLFVQSSFIEGLPNVVLEAMAASVAVVATTAGGTAEVVVEGETGMLLAPGDSGALASSMLTLLTDDTLRARMGRSGHRRVADHFTFEAQRKHYESLLQRWVPLQAPAVVTPQPELAASA